MSEKTSLNQALHNASVTGTSATITYHTTQNLLQ